MRIIIMAWILAAFFFVIFKIALVDWQQAFFANFLFIHVAMTLTIKAGLDRLSTSRNSPEHPGAAANLDQPPKARRWGL